MKGVPNLPLPTALEAALPGLAATGQRAPSAAVRVPLPEGVDALLRAERVAALSPSAVLMAKRLVDESVAARRRQLDPPRPAQAPCRGTAQADGDGSLTAHWRARVQRRLDRQAPGQWLVLADAADFAARRFRLVPLALVPEPVTIECDFDKSDGPAARC